MGMKRSSAAGYFLLFGLIFGCIGGGFGLVSLHSIRDKLTCQGVVIGFHSKTKGNQNSRGRDTVPVVEFTLEEKVFHIRGGGNSSFPPPPSYSIGERVLVYYPVDNPEKGFVGSFLELWLFMTVFGGIGVVFTLAGGVWVFFGWYGKG